MKEMERQTAQCIRLYAMFLIGCMLYLLPFLKLVFYFFSFRFHSSTSQLLDNSYQRTNLYAPAVSPRDSYEKTTKRGQKLADTIK